MWCIVMTEIKFKTTLEIQQHLEQYPGFKYRGVDLNHKSKNLSEFNKQIWKNTANKTSMQVTEMGYSILKFSMEKPLWEFELDEINSYDILKLDRYMPGPYYLNSKQKILCVFDENIATQLLLYGGDVRTFLDAQDGVSERPVRPKITVDNQNKNS